MEQFDKWQKKDCSSRECCPAIDYGEVACTDCEDLREAGWRAALEWVLDEFSLSPIGNKAIREELKGGAE